jgi:hypothetical protein
LEYFIYNVRVHLLYYIGSIQIIGTVSPSPSDPDRSSFNLTEIKFRISSRWDFRFVLPYHGSEVGLELDGGSIQVINLSEIISLEGGDDVCELGSILIFMINII